MPGAVGSIAVAFRIGWATSASAATGNETGLKFADDARQARCSEGSSADFRNIRHAFRAETAGDLVSTLGHNLFPPLSDALSYGPKPIS